MVGAFHMPRLVYTNAENSDDSFTGQFSSGMGEIIKHRLIKDAVLSVAERQPGRRSWRDLEACADMIERS